MASRRSLARFMMVTANMTERLFNLVVPLAHEATDMRATDTAGSSRVWSGAVSPLIGNSLRRGDVDSTNGRSTPRSLTTPGIRTSTTATRTTTTRAPSSAPAPSADQTARHHADFFYIDGPAVISFSGGRTSGMLLWKILESYGGQLPDDVRVLFANTGKEMPETLDFVHECSQRWNVPIVWLEYIDHDEPQRRWQQVTYETASRNGEPFAALIGRKRLLPNPVKRICTSETKIRVMKLYAQQVLGFKNWDVAIGYRADEPRRVAKLSAPHKEPYDRCAPLARAGVSSRDVMHFWQSQPFDLRLPNMNGKTMHGNCDLCYLKGAKQVFSLIREKPERALWWIEQEKRIPAGDKGNGHLFRNDRPSYQVMYDMAHNQGEFFEFVVRENYAAICAECVQKLCETIINESCSAPATANWSYGSTGEQVFDEGGSL